MLHRLHHLSLNLSLCPDTQFSLIGEKNIFAISTRTSREPTTFFTQAANLLSEESMIMRHHQSQYCFLASAALVAFLWCQRITATSAAAAFVVTSHSSRLSTTTTWRRRHEHVGSPSIPNSRTPFLRQLPRLHMALIPLEVPELQRILVMGAPNASQYATYWGRTSRERYASLFESGAVMLFGTIMSYFLSFVVGTFPSTILGCLCIFWIILSPEYQAYQRNWELRGGRELVDPWSVSPQEQEDKQGLYGALFLGRVASVSVVENYRSVEEYSLDDFQDYTMETDEQERFNGNPYMLRLKMRDSEGREMQVHTRMSEEYLDLEENQPILGVLLSTSQKFTRLAAMSDFLVPDAECWVGDYPYLDRFEMEAWLAEDDALWDQLESERIENNEYEAEYMTRGTRNDQQQEEESYYYQEGGDDEYGQEYDEYRYDDYYDDEDGDTTSDSPEKVPVRRRRQ